MMKLLLIDDDVFLRDMYAAKFADEGFTVETAQSASDAFRLLEQGADFSVILLDMIMPGMTGIEIIKKVQEQFPDLKTKFIILSNHGQQEDIKEATAAGAIGYIIKAESVPSDVVKKVNKLIEK